MKAGSDPADAAAEAVPGEPAWRQRAVSRSLTAARSRAAQRVQRFLDGAFELIDEKGTTDFTIQEVIDRSQQSVRGFYQYFDGKDELVLALLEETVREAGEDIHRAGVAAHAENGGEVLFLKAGVELLDLRFVAILGGLADAAGGEDVRRHV